MSGWTPGGISWSAIRRQETSTPCARMIAIELSINTCVLEVSGVRLSEQLRNSARRSEKSVFMVVAARHRRTALQASVAPRGERRHQLGAQRRRPIDVLLAQLAGQRQGAS